VPPPDELEPPLLLHAASSVTAATPAIPATANRLVLLGELPLDNIRGLLRWLVRGLPTP
jgi:hypothetical protein